MTIQTDNIRIKLIISYRNECPQKSSPACLAFLQRGAPPPFDCRVGKNYYLKYI